MWDLKLGGKMEETRIELKVSCSDTMLNYLSLQLGTGEHSLQL